MASCTERGIPTSAKKSSAITISPAQGWEIYLAGDEIVRLRKPGTEAIVDLSVIRLGPGGAYADFDSFYRQSSHVSLPSAVTGENEVIIDGVTAKRISFEGRRPDTGVPTAGERYLLESGSNGYFFVYLDAGDTIAKNREEARAMIEAIKLPK
jgi:hypothetical protein